MFLFGFLVGVAAAAAFILWGNGDLLIGLGERIKKTSDRFWTWQRSRHDR
jgi:hypothetical protein